jgi:hypothetical protein
MTPRRTAATSSVASKKARRMPGFFVAAWRT